MKKITLGDVAFEAKNTFSGDRNDVPVVGLEHLEPGEVQLFRWDSNSENTFTKSFRKGEVLFGRRRAYLKKAAVAPFDGICSGDITVIAAKGGKIQPELLPFIIQSERFFDYAVKGSAGSLSPRVKWEHLKNYEFALPPIEEQRKLADLLWAAYELKESYKKLLAATDEMVKAKFIEMFGDPVTNSKQKQVLPFKHFMTNIRYGVSLPPQFDDLGKYMFIRATNIKQGKIIDTGMLHISSIESPKLKKCKLDGGEIIIVRSGANTGDTCVVTEKYKGHYAGYDIIVSLNQNIANPSFFNVLLNTHYMKYVVKPLTERSAQPHINSEQVQNLPMLNIPICEQNKFMQFVDGCENSKAELNGAIAKLEQVMKSLLP